MFNNFLKKTNSESGIICSVWSVENIKYPDFVEVFGEPHVIKRSEAQWLYDLYTGAKIAIRYNKSDYTLKMMQKLKLQNMKEPDFKEIDELTIMGGEENAKIVVGFLSSIFPEIKSKHLDKKETIKRILRDERNKY
mgnify:CR=1 FL=1